MTSRFFIVLACCCLLLTPMVASSASMQERQAQFAPLFDGPCAKFNVPKALALAIARQESGINPWVINISGKDFYMRSREEALALAQAAYRAGRSFDVGLMQINRYWIKEYNLPLEVVVDPQSNVHIGVWILAQQIQQHGFNWRAVAYYHTPLHRNPERGRNYAALVLGHLRRIMSE